MSQEQIICPIHKIVSDKFCTSGYCTKSQTRLICKECLNSYHQNHDYQDLQKTQEFIEEQGFQFLQQIINENEKQNQRVIEYQQDIKQQIQEIKESFIKSLDECNEDIQKNLLTVQKQIQKKQNLYKNLITEETKSIELQKLNKDQQNIVLDIYELKNKSKQERRQQSINQVIDDHFQLFMEQLTMVSSQFTFQLDEQVKKNNKTLQYALIKHDQPQLVPFDPKTFNQKVQARFQGHSDQIFNLLQIKNKLITISGDSSLKVWDLSGQEKEYTYEFEGNVSAFALCPTLNGFAVGDSDFNITCFSTQYSIQKPVHIFYEAHDDLIVCLQQNNTNENNQIYSGSQEGIIKLWDIKTKENLRKYDFTELDLNRLQIYNGFLYAIDQNGQFKMWDTKKHYAYNKESLNQEIQCYCIIDMQHILFVNSKQTMFVYNIESNEVVVQLQSIHEEVVNSVRKIDNNYYGTCSDDKSAKIWHIYKNQEGILSINLVKTLKGQHTHNVLNMVKLKNDNLIATVSTDESIIVWK